MKEHILSARGVRLTILESGTATISFETERWSQRAINHMLPFIRSKMLGFSTTDVKMIFDSTVNHEVDALLGSGRMVIDHYGKYVPRKLSRAKAWNILSTVDSLDQENAELFEKNNLPVGVTLNDIKCELLKPRLNTKQSVACLEWDLASMNQVLTGMLIDSQNTIESKSFQDYASRNECDFLYP